MAHAFTPWIERSAATVTKGPLAVNRLVARCARAEASGLDTGVGCREIPIGLRFAALQTMADQFSKRFHARNGMAAALRRSRLARLRPSRRSASRDPQDLGRAGSTSSARRPLQVNLDAVLPTHLNRFRDIQRTRGNRVSQRFEHLDSVTSSPRYFNQFAAARPVTE